MSTRCTINFTYNKQVHSKIYRHYDGYPEGVKPDLKRFFQEVQKECQGDNRFNDPSYLAAKFVVWQARQNGEGLRFTGVAPVLEDPDDIEYTYFVNCSGNKPKVTHKKVP